MLKVKMVPEQVAGLQLCQLGDENYLCTLVSCTIFSNNFLFGVLLMFFIEPVKVTFGDGFKVEKKYSKQFSKLYYPYRVFIPVGVSIIPSKS